MSWSVKIFFAARALGASGICVQSEDLHEFESEDHANEEDVSLDSGQAYGSSSAAVNSFEGLHELENEDHESEADAGNATDDGASEDSDEQNPSSDDDSDDLYGGGDDNMDHAPNMNNEDIGDQDIVLEHYIENHLSENVYNVDRRDFRVDNDILIDKIFNGPVSVRVENEDGSADLHNGNDDDVLIDEGTIDFDLDPRLISANDNNLEHWGSFFDPFGFEAQNRFIAQMQGIPGLLRDQHSITQLFRAQDTSEQAVHNPIAHAVLEFYYTFGVDCGIKSVYGKNSDNETLLHKIPCYHNSAPFYGDLDLIGSVIDHLICMGVDPNARTNCSGHTVLERAISYSDTAAIAQVLMKHGCNPLARNHDGQTPMQYISSWHGVDPARIDFWRPYEDTFRRVSNLLRDKYGLFVSEYNNIMQVLKELTQECRNDARAVEIATTTKSKQAGLLDKLCTDVSRILMSFLLPDQVLLDAIGEMQALLNN